MAQSASEVREKQSSIPASPPLTLSGRTYAGVFLATLATLMYEILLTRIFSVVMWYHYAFVAISVALFGMTVGAVLVYLFPRYFTRDRTHHHLALSAWLFSLSIVLSFLTYASLALVMDSRSLVSLYTVALSYIVISVPFTFSGICVSLALTRFPQQVGRLYAADLAGAATGCLAVILTFRVTDGPGAILVAAVFAAAGAVLFGGDSAPALRRTALISTVLLALLAGGQAVSVGKQRPFLRLVWVKGQLESRALYERWNSFSRIRISGDPATPRPPVGWGLSSTVPAAAKARQLGLDIDSSTGTTLTALDGGLDRLQYLRYDVTNLVHYIRHDGKVLVIGAGGGRDVLSALLFGQRSVVAVELNGATVDAVNGPFGDFTGHLDRNPRVTFVTDEARSYIARQRSRFDVIQASFTTTLAATAAGAFVLSENSIYTIEAWKLFFDHLTDHGVLSFSRWYIRDNPTEMYRLTSLASASLKLAGIQDPRRHILIVRNVRRDYASHPEVGTLLASKEPFSDQDIATIERVARSMNFAVALSPRSAADATLAGLASARAPAVVAAFPLNIAPATDNQPFFFHLLRVRDIFKGALWSHRGGANFTFYWIAPVFTLLVLFLIVIGLTIACIIVPLLLTTKRAALRGSGPLFTFFAAIGFGFMFVEISQMERLMIFLGHPTYGLSVVLFALLLSTGLGSRLAQTTTRRGLTPAAARRRLIPLLLALVLFGALTPLAVTAFQSATTLVRILLAVSILFPLGTCLGMAFPVGMSIASAQHPGVTPWLWGVNGATSVCATVVATVVSLFAGISAAFWTGFACYATAWVALTVAAGALRAPAAIPERLRAARDLTA
jgi:hypothetical protein